MYRLQMDIKTNSKLSQTEYIGVLSKRFHAWVLKCIQKQNPLLSGMLHERKNRQVFSIYPTKKRMMIHSPRQDVMQCLQRELLTLNEIDLLSWRGEIADVRLRLVSEEDVLTRYAPKFRMDFLTPTTFYQGGNFYPLPEWNRLLLSANKVWAMCGNEPLPLEQINVFARQILVEKAAIHTQRVRFGKFNVIGFYGQMVLNLKTVENVNQRLLWKLLNYGAMMGFGYKTAWGLGQTSLTSVFSR